MTDRVYSILLDPLNTRSLLNYLWQPPLILSRKKQESKEFTELNGSLTAGDQR